MCPNFLQGKCRFGEICRFSHSQDAPKPAQETNSSWQPKSDKTPASIWSQLDAGNRPEDTRHELWKWRRDLPSDAAEARPLQFRLAGFFQQAQKLAAVEPGVTQEVITALASNGGLIRIGELVGRPFGTLNDATLTNIFRTQVVPFFKTLSHRNVDRSALLEARVASVYTYLFSPNGQRAVALFKATERFLGSIMKEDATDDDRDATDSCLLVMAKVMEINSTAHITEPFLPIFEEITALFEATLSDSEPFSRPAFKSLRKIQQRLNIGQSIPTSKAAPTLTNKPTFETPRDMPGDLSIEGPRHDNDYTCIATSRSFRRLERLLPREPSTCLLLTQVNGTSAASEDCWIVTSDS